MKRLIGFCAILALIQIGLTVVTNLAGHPGKTRSIKGVLLNLNAAEVNELLLEDGQGRTLELKKEGSRWLLPGADSFPADTVRVQGLIERLAGLQRGWPEATTVEAAGRFKVAPDRFERKLHLRRDGKDLGVVYFGTSPGLRRIYFRIDNDTEIQSLALAPHELDLKVDAWIDTAALGLKPEQVQRVELPGLILQRTGDGLVPADLKPEEELVREARDSLSKRLTGLSISGLLGKESKPEYGLEKPFLQYTVELEGGERVGYRFGRQARAGNKGQEQQGALPAAESAFVLKVSGKEQLFSVDSWQVEEISKASRGALVRAKAQEPAAPRQEAPGQ